MQGGAGGSVRGAGGVEGAEGGVRAYETTLKKI